MNLQKSIPDANNFSNKPSDFGHKSDCSVFTNDVDLNDDYYDMSGDKYLLIFNHHTYNTTVYFRNVRPGDRMGTDVDVCSLTRVFHKMNYKVSCYNDFEYDNIMNTIKYFSNQDHSNTSCVCIAFLTHGDKNEELLYAADRPYSLREIVIKLDNGDQGLLQKPKLLFIQASRGDNLNANRISSVDGASSSMIIPSIDILIFRSSAAGYPSFRNSYDSFMIQELCKAVENNKDKDIHYITTLLNMRVAHYYSTYRPGNKNTNNMKQIIEVKHTLTKLFRF